MDERITTERFTDRVAFYVRYRPRYPQALVGHLAAAGGLRPHHVVADLGSGTGFLTEVFLRNGNTVYGIDPNANMRAAGEALLAAYPRFHSVDATAEATGLPAASLDWVVAGQAFHWFDADATGRECRRILKPGGTAALVWNERDAEGSPFMQAYDALLRRHAPAYKEVGHRDIGDAVFAAFFGGPWERAEFPHAQRFDREGLRGRVLSASYVPAAGQPGHDALLAALDALFAQHAEDGTVAFAYRARVFWGALA